MLCYFFSWVRDKEMPNCLHKLWQVPLQPNKSNKMKRSLNMRLKQRTKQKSSSDIKPFIWQKLKVKQGWSEPCFDTLPLIPYCVNHTVFFFQHFHKEGKHGWINCSLTMTFTQRFLTGFLTTWGLRNKRRNCIMMMPHYPDLSSASDCWGKFPTRKHHSGTISNNNMQTNNNNNHY